MSEQFEKDLKRLEVLREQLEQNGYFSLKVIEGRGICGLNKFIFTVGLCFGLDHVGFDGRWCYEHVHAVDAALALEIWDGKNDPPGRWIKYKGKYAEYWNPKSIIQDV